MSNKQLVLAFFENEAAADTAVTEIKQWDKASKDVKLGAIGVLVKDEKGKIKTHKLGKRQTALGAILFGIAGILSGGMSVVGGALFGGILGSFFHKGLGMSKDDLARIDSDLDDGKAAVAVLAKADEADAISGKLAELGGVAEQHTVTEDALEHAEDAAENAPEEEAAE
jgi:outer membrane lipoprotein SlyB